MYGYETICKTEPEDQDDYIHEFEAFKKECVTNKENISPDTIISKSMYFFSFIFILVSLMFKHYTNNNIERVTQEMSVDTVYKLITKMYP